MSDECKACHQPPDWLRSLRVYPSECELGKRAGCLLANEPRRGQVGSVSLRAPDVRRGLYRHYKGNFYRVLFTARYMGKGDLVPDEVVEFFISLDEAVGVTDAVGLVIDRPTAIRRNAFLARNSTDGPTPTGCMLVIYVCLYGNGRVSVREAGEFAADVDGAPRFQLHGDDCEIVEFGTCTCDAPKCTTCRGTGKVDRNARRVDFDADGPSTERCPDCGGSGRPVAKAGS